MGSWFRVVGLHPLVSPGVESTGVLVVPLTFLTDVSVLVLMVDTLIMAVSYCMLLLVMIVSFAGLGLNE